MNTKRVNIRELQPTDYPIKENIEFLELLSREQMERLNKIIGHPQVWETDHGTIISDGNKRIALSAKRGEETVEVDYHHKGHKYAFLTNFETLEGAKQLREQGVYSPFDFWKVA